MTTFTMTVTLETPRGVVTETQRLEDSALAPLLDLVSRTSGDFVREIHAWDPAFVPVLLVVED